jgi:rhodanese-related sulfurtransferase
MTGIVQLSPGDPPRIGAYTLVGRLGEGGQGIVYLGSSPAGELRAIKVLQPPWLADPSARSRLAREVAAARQVAAFCTATVIEASLDGSLPYIVTEFVDGPTLAEHVQCQGPVCGPDLERLAIGTATALVAIHQAGVVHRDFKPSNVILSSQGPRVIDFGIAHVLSSTPITLTHQMLGTPRFMAPEQVLGEPVGPPADLFAWACTLAYAATSRAPFTGPNLAAIVHRMTSAEPDLTGIPRPLADILPLCLTKDPTGRPTAQQTLLLLLGQPLPRSDLHDPTELLTHAAATTVPAPTQISAVTGTARVPVAGVPVAGFPAAGVPAAGVPAATMTAVAPWSTRLDPLVPRAAASWNMPAPRPAPPGTAASWGPSPVLAPPGSGRLLVTLTLVTAVLVMAVTGWLGARALSTVLESTNGFSAAPAAFDLPALTGNTHVRLADHRGHPVVVAFFASWCVYCNLELPGLAQVARASTGKIDFIGIQTHDTGDGLAMAGRFDLARAGITLARDIGTAPASRLWSAFGGQGIPATAFYDTNGRLVDFTTGMFTEPQLQQQLRTTFGLDIRAADASALQTPVIPLTPQGTAELLDNTSLRPSFALLDVRTPVEFATGHLQAASNIDAAASNLRHRLATLPRGRSYIVYCRNGTRSSDVAGTMHAMGFTHVYDVQGGLDAWAQAGLPVT